MQIQISWLLEKPTDLDLHCLQNRIYPGSAGQGLRVMDTFLWEATLSKLFLCLLKRKANSFLILYSRYIFQKRTKQVGNLKSFSHAENGSKIHKCILPPLCKNSKKIFLIIILVVSLLGADHECLQTCMN